MTNSIRRQASHLLLGVAFALTSLTVAPGWAGNETLPKTISGDFQRLRGQWVTKGKSAELAFVSGGRIRVRENTDASIMVEPQSLMLPPGKKIPTYTVILRRGLVEIELPESADSRVAVAVGTPTDTRIIALSGKSSVHVAGRNVAAASYSGIATVNQGTKLTKLPSGVVRQFRANGAVADRALLDATQWIGGRRVWVTQPDSLARPGGYVWSPVEGASGYFVSLRSHDAKHPVADSFVKAPIVEDFAKGVAPGKYELSITAVDADGFCSLKHGTVPVHVVGLDVPGGAVLLPKDTVQVAPEQRVRLTHAEGLRLTTADHRTNVPAWEPFGLEGLDRAVVLIHPKDGGDAAPITLLRRQPSVSAWVGPKLATWPDDPVNLQVSFVDDQGRPTPDAIQPSVRVMVGTEAVNVDWQKQGSLWQARLQSPPKGKGPWVVRLEILDQYGSIIGRDFAEITKTRKQIKYYEHLESGTATATAMRPVESAQLEP